MKTITARYPGTCRLCGEPIEQGTRVKWSRSEGANHIGCVNKARELSRSAPPEDYDDDGSLAQARRDDADYAQGVAEANRYLSDVKCYGRELAEQWEMEAELARYNRGEDY